MIDTLPARQRGTQRPALDKSQSQRPQALEPLESRLCLSAAAANVYAQGSTVDGHSLGEWAQAWSKYVYETPAPTNPLHDATGALAAANQPKGVFFLAGSDSTAKVDRTVTVKPGTKLFIPVLTNIWITLPTDEPITIGQIREFLDQQMDTTTGAFLTIDGKAVSDVASHREVDPNPSGFTTNLPADNIFGVPAGSYPKSATDGIFVMAQPLTPGQHTIHFGGTIPAAGNFTLDVTYHVNVVPPGEAEPPAPPAFSTKPNKSDGKDDKDCWDD